jgi:hypothetical protein
MLGRRHRRRSGDVSQGTRTSTAARTCRLHPCTQASHECSCRACPHRGTPAGAAEDGSASLLIACAGPRRMLEALRFACGSLSACALACMYA